MRTHSAIKCTSLGSHGFSGQPKTFTCILNADVPVLDWLLLAYQYLACLLHFPVTGSISTTEKKRWTSYTVFRNLRNAANGQSEASYDAILVSHRKQCSCFTHKKNKVGVKLWFTTEKSNYDVQYKSNNSILCMCEICKINMAAEYCKSSISKCDFSMPHYWSARKKLFCKSMSWYHEN